MASRSGGGRDVARDAVVGLAGAISRVPDSMAAALVAGVNPVYGLYAGAAGLIAGGLTVSTRLMVITTTTAAALAANSALSEVDADDRLAALSLLTLLAGAMMLAAGLLRLGRYTRFVSHSVMVGFLTGVAVNILFGQLGTLAGVAAEGEHAIGKALSVLTRPGAVQLGSLLVGLAAIGLIVWIGRTRLAVIAALVAVVVPTAAAALLGFDPATVADTGEIPRGLPPPVLPDLGLLSVDLVFGAASVAVIVLVQGAGVSESAPNPDGRPAKADRDFAAQGIANAAAGLVQGMPVGGSLGQTAFNRATGARTRWAAVFSGVWVLAVLVALAGPIGLVAMPVLAGLLIYAAVGSIRPADIVVILRTGNASRVAFACTFAGTLLLPLTYAVGLGVAISLVMQLNREALDLRVVRLRPLADGRMLEEPAPGRLPDDRVTVLDVYGSLLYAGSRTLAARLPDPAGSHRAAVVLRLRGRTSLGATFFRVVGDYARALEQHGGRLYLSGLSPQVLLQLQAAAMLRVSGPVYPMPASDIVGASTAKAVHEAEAWLVEGGEPEG